MYIISVVEDCIISVTCLYVCKEEVEGRRLWQKWASYRNQLMAGRERISGKAAINLSWVSINLFCGQSEVSTTLWLQGVIA